ncbi:MAG: tetratricopeptide repeat protein [bacterium]
MNSRQLSVVSKKLLIIFLLILSFSGCKRSVEEQNELAKGYFEKAQSLFKLEDETGALIVDLDEDLQQKEKWLKASEEYVKIVEGYPDSKYILESMEAVIKIKQRYGSYKEYVPLYHRIIKEFPESPYAKEGKDIIEKIAKRLMISADDYAYKKQNNWAVEEYKNSLFVNPDLIETNYKLALTYEKMGLYKQAKSALRKADKLPESHYTLGLAYYSQSKWNKAIEEFEKAISIKQNYSPAYMNLALVYEKINDKDKAKEIWRKYLEHALEDQNEGKWVPTAEEHLKESP